MCACVCDSPRKLGKMNGFYCSLCWSHVAIKWIFGDAPRTRDSHGPRRGQNSNQCPGSSNYCLLWLIIPQSFDQAIAPVSREGGGLCGPLIGGCQDALLSQCMPGENGVLLSSQPPFSPHTEKQKGKKKQNKKTTSLLHRKQRRKRFIF